MRVSAAQFYSDAVAAAPGVVVRYVVVGGQRRAGIELRRPVDVDADAAVSLMDEYKQVLKA